MMGMFDMITGAGGMFGGPSPRLETALSPTRGMPSAGGINSLGLTPQELYLYEHHVGNTLTKPVKNKDGSTSTVLQRVVDGPGGRFYNIPSVWDGKILGEQDARRRAAAQGWQNWPSYATPDEADARYELMHQLMSMDVE